MTRAFRELNACPSTGQFTGPCPGLVIDHGYPLCAGGADAVWNLAWQELGASKVKDRYEKALCRSLHDGSASAGAR